MSMNIRGEYVHVHTQSADPICWWYPISCFITRGDISMYMQEEYVDVYTQSEDAICWRYPRGNMSMYIHNLKMPFVGGIPFVVYHQGEYIYKRQNIHDLKIV